MSAAQSKSPDTRAAEPSMEEILASIRRIISDDQTAKPAAAPEPAAAAAAVEPPAPPPAPPAPVEEEEILELTPKAAERAPRRQEPHFITDDPVDNDISFQDPKPSAPAAQDDIDALMAAAEFEPTPPAPPPSPLSINPPSPAPQPERLISPATDRMVSTAFTSLANTVLTNNARTLDDLVQEMMRPMIKAWLDDNLPTVVERLVRAEIERVARGGR